MIYFFLILIILIIGHELGHFLTSRLFKVDVEEFGFGFPPRLAFIKKNDTIYSLNLIPLGGFVKIKGENGKAEIGDKTNFSNQKIWKRALIVVAGVTFNIVLSFVILSFLFSFGMPTLGDTTDVDQLIKNGATIKSKEIMVTEIAKSSPAEQHLKLDDKIIGFGIPNSFMADIYTIKGFQSFVNMNKGKEILLKVERNNQISNVTLIPRILSPKGEGAVGIAYTGAILYTYPFGRNFIEAGKYISQTITAMFNSLGKAFVSIFNFKTASKEVAGPVGIANMTGKISRMGLPFFFAFMASLSINLAFMNLLPIPVLDGGKLFFLLLEKIKGSPLNRKIENYATIGGFVFLMSLVLIVTVKDIINLF